MDSKPVAQFKVHEHLRSKLCDLYESDSIFDKFQCCLSDDGSHLATGSYGNTFRTFDTHAGRGHAGGYQDPSEAPNGTRSGGDGRVPELEPESGGRFDGAGVG